MTVSDVVRTESVCKSSLPCLQLYVAGIVFSGQVGNDDAMFDRACIDGIQ
jgi:hypothetical protein